MSQSSHYLAEMLLFSYIKLLLLCTPLTLGHPFPRQYGDPCDWRSPSEMCDESRSLGCSYKTQRCECWDSRTIYSIGKDRCVGKASEECHSFGGERLCTENAYCLEDENLSPTPICLCLKGYFKGINGSCVRRSKHGEFCDLSSKPTSSSSSGHSNSCEPESGLQCVNYLCRCESNQIYDSKRELCISLAGHPCSKSLNNCVQNAECSEKIWAFDHTSGETKMIGHRCACKSGLKVSQGGFCAVEYGGKCSSSSECYYGEGLTCINGKCMCHPLSQVYDKRMRRCLYLAGSLCHKRPQDPHRQLYLDDERGRPEVALSQSIATPAPVTFTSTIATTTSTTTAKISVSPKPSTTPQSRNGTSRNLKLDYNPQNFTYSRSYVQIRPPRNSFPDSGSSPGTCISNAECLPSSTTPHESYCKCKNGSSETVMRTCLLDFGQPCGNKDYCNIFEGLACMTDSGTCQCADPILVYDEETKQCLATLGNPCGKMKLNSMLLNSIDKESQDEAGFYHYQPEQFTYVNCVMEATCVDKSVNGQFKQVCVPRGKFPPSKFGFAIQ